MRHRRGCVTTMVSAVVDPVAEGDEGWAGSAALGRDKRGHGGYPKSTGGEEPVQRHPNDHTPFVTSSSPQAIDTCVKKFLPCFRSEREGNAL